MNREIKLFLSSTFDEKMQDFRNEINAELNRIVGQIGKNLFLYDYGLGIPNDETLSNALDIILQKIDESDYFVGIVGNNYGTHINDVLERSRVYYKGKYKELIDEGIQKNLSALELEFIESLKNINQKKLFFIQITIYENNTKIQNLIARIKTSANLNVKVFFYNEYLDILHTLKQYFENEFKNEIDKRFPTDFPPNNLPERRNIRFTSRDEKLEEIHNTFEKQENVALTQAIAGLGGIGKTQTALEYAYRYGKEYDRIWWVNADTENNLLASFQNFAKEMKIIDENTKKAEDIIKAVRHWMQENDNWLFIYDNAEEFKKDKKSKDSRTFEDYLPINNTGRRHVLITSRSDRFSNCIILKLNVFTEKDACDFIKKYTRKPADEHFKELAKEMGYLPLALDQAGEYMKVNGTSYKEYLDLYRDNKLKLLTKYDDHPDKKTVATTWLISFEKIENPASKDLLNLCAFFAHDNILKQWFKKASAVLPESLQAVVSDDLEYNEAIAELTKYSLVNIEEGALSLHRLVQEVIRDSLKKEETQWRNVCIKILNVLCYEDFSSSASRDLFRTLTTHIISVTHGIQDEEATKEVAELYHFLGRGFYESAFYSQALKWYEKDLIIREKVLGKEHPDTATTYNSMARVYSAQRNYNRAMEYYNKALEIREVILGKEHLDTAATYNNIAGVYHSQGIYGFAWEYYVKALEIREKVLGKEHPDTATTYSNIAGVYYAQENYDSAWEYYGKALEIREKVLGKEHPDTATTYNNIAGVYFEQKNYDSAWEYYIKALEIREKVLGEGHLDTATTYNNIAGVYHAQGNYERALEYYDKAVKTQETVLGNEHPDTAHTYKNIAKVYVAQDNKNRALEYYEKAVDILEKESRYSNIAQGNYDSTWESSTKPKEILELEKIYGITLDNRYGLDNKNEIITLNLSGYRITEIKGLEQLTQLQKLDLSGNQIKSIEPLENIIKSLKKLDELKIYDNAFSNPRLQKNENNLVAVRKYFSDKKLKQKEFKLPAKVMFLGNHASGKSTFLYYLQHNKLPEEEIESTHILSISPYYLPDEYKQEETEILPDAMIYDFGGHDYYHGIYHAFYSQKSITLLMWCKKSDKNEAGSTINELGQTLNFTRNYWLHQLNIFNKQEQKSLDEKQEVVFMVQTHIDENNRENYVGNYSDFNIWNEYYISLNNDYAAKNKHERCLNHLKEDLFLKISIKRDETIKKRPEYYEDFFNFVITYSKNYPNSQYIKVEEILENHYKRKKNKGETNAILLSYLKEDLMDLNDTGLIIYYKDDEYAWLNPQKTIKYIHDNILTQNIIRESKGKISELKFDEMLNTDTDNKEKIKSLLLKQKVVFHDKYTKQYIIPGYLPLYNERPNLMNSFFKVKPNYTLRFKSFLPFGLINQLICLYGGQPYEKEFWRDRLIFAFDQAYIISIILDFSTLEIRVHIHEKEKSSFMPLQDLEKFIFLNIIDLYNNKNSNEIPKSRKPDIIKEYIQQHRIDTPEDLYVSLDEKHFLRHRIIEELKENPTSTITVYPINDETKEIDKEKPTTRKILDYILFTNNKNIKKMGKKIFISYSKEDISEMHDFVEHTAGLQNDGLIAEPWTDKRIEFGKEWDDEIKRQIKECDIMVCLISKSFLNKDYIKVELKEAMEQGKTLVPIIIKPCDWKGFDFAKHQAALKGKCITLNENQKYAIEENSAIERAEIWVKVIEEMRVKIFHETN